MHLAFCFLRVSIKQSSVKSRSTYNHKHTPLSLYLSTLPLLPPTPLRHPFSFSVLTTTTVLRVSLSSHASVNLSNSFSIHSPNQHIINVATFIYSIYMSPNNGLQSVYSLRIHSLTHRRLKQVPLLVLMQQVSV